MDIHGFVQSAIPLLTVFGLKVIGAIILWVIGRKLIGFARVLIVRSLKAPFDQTVATYIGTAVSVTLTLALIIALLSFFGVETTSFAALLAGVGIAIGAAWSGRLANLAAGVFLLILRPFKVGDFISAGGILGTVDEIGLFVTSVTTLDNVRTFVGNAKILGDNTQNFTANPYQSRGSARPARQQRRPRGGHPARQGAAEADSQPTRTAPFARWAARGNFPRLGNTSSSTG